MFYTMMCPIFFVFLRIFFVKNLQTDIVAVGVKPTISGYEPAELGLLTISASLLYHMPKRLSIVKIMNGRFLQCKKSKRRQLRCLLLRIAHSFRKSGEVQSIFYSTSASLFLHIILLRIFARLQKRGFIIRLPRSPCAWKAPRIRTRAHGTSSLLSIRSPYIPRSVLQGNCR